MTNNSDSAAERPSTAVKVTATWPVLRRMIAEMVRPYVGYLIIAGFCMAVVAAGTSGTAWLLDPVVNKVFVARDESMLWPIGLAVVVVFSLKSLAAFIQEVLMGFVGQKIVANTQDRLFKHLIGHDLALFQARHSGRLISHFTFDINAMRIATSNILVGLGRDSMTLLALVAVMFYQDWLLALITLVVGPLSAYPMQVIGRRMRRYSSATQEEMGALTTHLAQSFQGVKLIQSSSMESHEQSRVAALVDAVFVLTFKSARVRAAAQPIIDAMGGIAVAAVIVYGGYRVIDGTTSPGAFFSFIAAALMAYQPLRALGKLNASLQEGLAAAERVFELLDTPPQITDADSPRQLPAGSGAVIFDNVRFSYDGQQAALDGIGFTAPAGKITALVGPSGAGKSTVFALIPRFFDVDDGTITVNGIDVRTAERHSLRGHLAVVSQDVTLFDDSVINNIRYGRLSASDAEVHAAAEAAAADGFISALPAGYETIIGEHGVRLSGGQRQRIAIARAILKDAPILLLDEATSALDTESERQIQAALERLMVGRTSLVIAHRLSTVAHADVIHVFDHGQIVETGDHQTLLAKAGLYAHLHGLQFQEPAQPAD